MQSGLLVQTIGTSCVGLECLNLSLAGATWARAAKLSTKHNVEEPNQFDEPNPFAVRQATIGNAAAGGSGELPAVHVQTSRSLDQARPDSGIGDRRDANANAASSLRTNANILELLGNKRVFYNGAGAKEGFMDMACSFKWSSAISADRCACQLRVRSRADKAEALRHCARHSACAAVSLNGPTLEASEWATLKQARNLTMAVDEAELLRRRNRMHTTRRPKRQQATEPFFPRVVTRSWLGGHSDHASRQAWQRMSGQAAGINVTSSHASRVCGPTNHPMLGSTSLGILALTFRTPHSLAASMRSWSNGGLLALASERILVASEPLPLERLIAEAFSFVLVEPKQMSPRHAKLIQRNVATIGAIFGWAMRTLRSTFLLFLEKDFQLIPINDLARVAAELYGAALMLARGASVVYLRSRTDQGCGTFPSCKTVRFAQDGPAWEKKNNWWNFYCDGFKARDGRIEDCLKLTPLPPSTMPTGVQPPAATPTAATPTAATPPSPPWEARFRCYTSEDANWSLNAALVHRQRAAQKKLAVGTDKSSQRSSRSSLAKLGADAWSRQDEFEMSLVERDWGRWKVPLCLSFYGLFGHHEVDG